MNHTGFWLITCLWLTFAATLSAQNTTHSQPIWQEIYTSIAQDYTEGNFGPDVQGDTLTLIKGDLRISGYGTANREFMNSIIKPALKPYQTELARLPKLQLINTLAIIIFNSYQLYLGKEFYRWGGDLLDLDDPQSEGIRYQYRYGLDCSGFTVSAYELAVELGMINADDPAALFSSSGYRNYCLNHQLRDKGGREGTPNRYRLDTSELVGLGREILAISQNGILTPKDKKRLQAGDILGLNGHFGIIVELEDGLYYLESGGWVVPPSGGKPAPIADAIKIFALKGALTIRRCLPDSE